MLPIGIHNIGNLREREKRNTQRQSDGLIREL